MLETVARCEGVSEMKRPAFEIVQAEGRSGFRTKGWLLRPVRSIYLKAWTCQPLCENADGALILFSVFRYRQRLSFLQKAGQ